MYYICIGYIYIFVIWHCVQTFLRKLIRTVNHRNIILDFNWKLWNESDHQFRHCHSHREIERDKEREIVIERSLNWSKLQKSGHKSILTLEINCYSFHSKKKIVIVFLLFLNSLAQEFVVFAYNLRSIAQFRIAMQKVRANNKNILL